MAKKYMYCVYWNEVREQFCFMQTLRARNLGIPLLKMDMTKEQAISFIKEMNDEALELIRDSVRKRKGEWLMPIKPTVGRIVYYKSYGTPGGEYQSEDRAAIITQVHTDECVDLCVLNPTGMFFNTSVMRDESGKGGTWDWMPYQKEQATKVGE